MIDLHLAKASMDDRNEGEPDPGQHTLRRTVVHMIEEYARHCGQADLLREAHEGSPATDPPAGRGELAAVAAP